MPGRPFAATSGNAHPTGMARHRPDNPSLFRIHVPREPRRRAPTRRCRCRKSQRLHAAHTPASLRITTAPSQVDYHDSSARRAGCARRADGTNAALVERRSRRQPRGGILLLGWGGCLMVARRVGRQSSSASSGPVRTGWLFIGGLRSGPAFPWGSSHHGCTHTVDASGPASSTGIDACHCRDRDGRGYGFRHPRRGGGHLRPTPTTVTASPAARAPHEPRYRRTRTYSRSHGPNAAPPGAHGQRTRPESDESERVRP